MTERKVTNLAASIRQRLQNAAMASGRPFQEVAQYYAVERFLYRLSVSKHADKFVLKGALMLNRIPPHDACSRTIDALLQLLCRP